MVEMDQKKTSVFVRHLARDPVTRTARRLRPTNQLDFMLADGRRIRRKNVRTTELSMKEITDNLSRLQEAVDNCVIEVLSAAGSPLSSKDLASIAGGKAPEKTQVKTDPKPAMETAEKPALVESEVEESFFEDAPDEDKSSKKASKKGRKE